VPPGEGNVAILEQPFDQWIQGDPRAVTQIPWTHRTNNPAVGCKAKDPSCGPCWASDLVARRMSRNDNLPRYKGLAVLREDTGQAKWDGRVELFPERLVEPLSWRTPSRVFWCDLSDLFYEEIPFEYIAACFGIAALSARHQHQFLTRRMDRALAFFAWLRNQVGDSQIRQYDGRALTLFCIKAAERVNVPGMEKACELARKRATRAKFALKAPVSWPIQNVHLGFSASTLALFIDRWAMLRACEKDVAIRWVSYEAAYEPCDFERALREGLDWVVMGGESSSSGARDFRMGWAANALAACRANKKPFFMKQAGTLWAIRHNAKQRKGEDMLEWPEALRVREFPVALPLEPSPNRPASTEHVP